MLPPWDYISAPSVIDHLWQSTVAAVAFLGLLAVGRRLSARTRLWLAWAALLKFLIPVAAFLNALSHTVAHNARPLPVWETPFSIPTALSDRVVESALVSKSSPSLSTGQIFAAIWLCGAVISICLSLLRSALLRRSISENTASVSKELQPHIEAAACRCGLKKAPHCQEVPDRFGPALIGTFSPTVILPSSLKSTLTPAELEAVLLHEFIHFRRKDNLLNFLRTLLVGLFWFNPIVWLLSQAIRRETERACDEAVLAHAVTPENYAESIVKTVRLLVGLPQKPMLGATSLRVADRVAAIQFYNQQKRWPACTTVFFLLAGGGLLAGCGLISIKSHQPTLYTAQTTPVETTTVPVPSPVTVKALPPSENIAATAVNSPPMPNPAVIAEEQKIAYACELFRTKFGGWPASIEDIASTFDGLNLSLFESMEFRAMAADKLSIRSISGGTNYGTSAYPREMSNTVQKLDAGETSRVESKMYSFTVHKVGQGEGHYAFTTLPPLPATTVINR